MIDTMKLGFKVLSGILKEKSPDIFVGVGLSLIAGGCVVACKETLKTPKINEKHKTEIKEIEDLAGTTNGEVIYTEKQASIDTAKEYAVWSLDYVRNYAPSVTMIGVGTFLVLYSHRILKDRNAALTATISSLDMLLQGYRQRVKKEIGDEREHDIFHNIEKEVYPEEYEDSKGRKKTKLSEKDTGIGDKRGTHSIEFTADAPEVQWAFRAGGGYNQIFVNNAEMMFNKMLYGRRDVNDPDSYVSLTEKEIFDYFRSNGVDKYPSLRLSSGWVYRERDAESYDYYPDGRTPRIIKFGVSSSFAKGETDETWIDLNPINLQEFFGYLEDSKYNQKRKTGKYIAA